VAERGHGRADRSDQCGHILVFTLDVVIGRIGITVTVAAPIQRIDRVVLRQQR
jgi:hypothetical protein